MLNAFFCSSHVNAGNGKSLGNGVGKATQTS